MTDLPMTRNRIIQHLINKNGYKSYLEIGVEYGQTFNKILCLKKVGIEPNVAGWLEMASDEFFAQNKDIFDIIFIDGLHEKEQAERDIENSIKILSPGGAIVVHDCNPASEAMQKVPREQLEWTGDVWKAFVKFRNDPDLEMYVVDTDYGCGVIKKGAQEPLNVEEMTYEKLSQNKKKWLNLISVDEFLTKIQ